jgi:hypothetical protein
LGVIIQYGLSVLLLYLGSASYKSGGEAMLGRLVRQVLRLRR